jgi:hypothetical protein
LNISCQFPVRQDQLRPAAYRLRPAVKISAEFWLFPSTGGRRETSSYGEMIEPQRHRGRHMASGRQQSLISRKKRKKAKERRREGQEAPQEYSVFASSFVFCGSLVFFRLLPAFVAGETKCCSFAGGGNSQFLAGDGWASAPSPPGRLCKTKPS